MKKLHILTTLCLTAFVLLVISVLEMARLRHQADSAFERGRQRGLRECQEPSRLEKAAEWLAD